MRLNSDIQIQIPRSEIELKFETNLCLIRSDVHAAALSTVIGCFWHISNFGITALEEYSNKDNVEKKK